MVRKFGLLLAIMFLFILAAGCSGKVSQQDKNGESPSEFVLKYGKADMNNDINTIKTMLSDEALKKAKNVLSLDYKPLNRQLKRYRLYESEKNGVYYYKFEYENEEKSGTKYYKVIKENGTWKNADYYYQEKDYLFDTKGLETKMIEGAVK
jgi:hypothetical protein